MNEESKLSLAGQVNRIPCDTFKEAMEKATEEASNSGATSYPVVMFRQGDRWNFSGALPMKRVERFLDLTKAARKGDRVEQLRTASNRPHIAEHSAAIANYIKENPRDYIIPGLTLNVQGTINVYVPNGTSTIKTAFMVIPDTAPAAPTDGQHRCHGIIKAMQEMSQEDYAQFQQDGVAFMLTCEIDIQKAHQDFADCSKTKQLPPAMLTVYDLRNRANGLVIKLVDACPVFKDKVDSTSKTIGSNSPYLFTTNQVRQMVKALLTGDFGLADATFAERAKDLLPTNELYQTELEKMEGYVNYLTEHLGVWKEVSEVPAGIQHANLKRIRSRGYVCLTATGLNIIGRIGHELLTRHPSDWKRYAEKLAKLDWLKSDPRWTDIVQQKKDKKGDAVFEEIEIDGRKERRSVMQIVTNRAPLNRAIYKVAREIGLSLHEGASHSDDADSEQFEAEQLAATV